VKPSGGGGGAGGPGSGVAAVLMERGRKSEPACERESRLGGGGDQRPG
jgi:hypothetical protein